MSISAIILDPCTGQETEQPLGVGQFRPDAGGRNKFTARIDGNTAVDYSREYRLTLSTGEARTKNGLLAGQYVQPVLLWIQPELLQPGIPPIPNEFEHLTHLTQGVAFDQRTGHFFGPLDPFPQSGVTVANTSRCAGAGGAGSTVPIPTISASIVLSGDVTTASTNTRLFARPGDRVLLTGGQANPGITADAAQYGWTLVANGSAGALEDLVNVTTSSDNHALEASFPTGGAPTGDYVFRLNITGRASNLTAPVSGYTTINVTLFDGADAVEVDSVTWTSTQSGTIGVVCSSTYFVDAKTGLTVQYTSDSGGATSSMSAAPPDSGSWSFSSRSAPRPGTVVCRSKLGGSATQVGVTV